MNSLVRVCASCGVLLDIFVACGPWVPLPLCLGPSFASPPAASGNCWFSNCGQAVELDIPDRLSYHRLSETTRRERPGSGWRSDRVGRELGVRCFCF